jgi:hypothetical protein
MIDPGLRLTMFTLSLAGLLSAVSSQTQRVIQSLYCDRLLSPLFVLLIWAVAVTVSQLIFLPEVQVSGEVMRSPLVRPVVQLFSFVMAFIPLFTAPFVLNRR